MGRWGSLNREGYPSNYRLYSTILNLNPMREFREDLKIEGPTLTFFCLFFVVENIKMPLKEGNHRPTSERHFNGIVTLN